MQDVLAITIVAAAAFYLAWRAWRHFARSGGVCRTCPGCHADDPIPTRPLVSISLDAPRK